ncbi:MAG: hypothetical protein A2Y40_00005 [Candidatus Margulisbacteria bacterium GWF2_35_9]|nr:MAG: hypothetical protein A2Y40_00005 [Candidatus Margulisbacteria bacterium GWF2_35_9]
MFRSILLLVLTAILFAAPFPNDKNWKFYQTKHFNIYFNSQTRVVADRAFDMIEDIYEKVSGELFYSPIDRIDLVFTDQTDSVNGYADYFRQTIVMEVSPVPDVVFGPFSKDVLWNLLVHELTHIIHMGMNYSNGFVYSFAKRLTSKGFLYPYFISEGYAVYNEKLIAKGGRLNNSYYNEHMMAFAKYNNFPTLNQISYASMLRFPQGSGPYIVGAEFVDYLCKRYGKRKLITAFHYFSRKQYISSFEMAFEKIYDKTLNAAYQEFIDYVKLGMINNSKDESPYELIVTGDIYAQNPQWISPDEIVYYLNDLKEDPQIIKSNLSGTQKGKLYSDPALSNQYLLIHDDLYFIKYELDNLYMSSHKLFKYNLITHTEELVEAGVVDFDRTEDGLLYIKEDGDIHSLYLNVGPKEPVLIVTADNIGSIKICESDIFYVKRKGTDNALYQYNIQTGTENRLLSGNIRDIFLEDNYLYFVADWEGLSQLYLYNSASGKCEKKTQVLTGVFNPSILDDTLLYSTLTDRGFSLALISDFTKIDISTTQMLDYYQPKIVSQDKFIYVTNDVEVTMNSINEKKSTSNIYANIFDEKYPKTAKKYSIWNLNSFYFIPWMTISDYGSSVAFMTMFADPLLYQQFSARFQYNLGYESYNFSYLNTAIYPYIQVQAVKADADRYSQELLLFPTTIGRQYHEIDIGLEQREENNEKSDYIYSSYLWSSLNKYPYSISYEKGFQNYLSLRTRQGDYKKTIVDQLSLFLPGLDVNHVLFVDATIGLSSVGEFTVGGYPRTLSVRGYDYLTKRKGSRFAKLSIEYRFPIIVVDDYLLFGYYVPQLDCSVFMDTADASGSMSALFSSDVFRSFGFLINMKGVQFNTYLFEFGIGFATSTEKNTSIIFSFGTNFSL